MKHLKIVIALTLTVTISMMSIFVVEGITTPIIDDYLQKLADEALYSIMSEFDGTFTDITEDYDLDGTTILEIKKGENEGIVYKASFQGYASVITYMVGVSLIDDTVYGLTIIEQGDSAGFGANIAVPEYADQFKGIAQEDLGNGDFDGVTGATITTGGFEGSLAKVMEFHSVTFAGGVVVSDEELRAGMMDDLFVGGVFTEVTGDHPTNDNILKVYEAKVDSVLVGYVYLVEGSGAVVAGGNSFEYYIGIDLDKNYTGFRMYENNDTASFAEPYLTDDFGDTYVNVALGSEDVIDAYTAGTSQTRATIISSTVSLMEYHIIDVLGEDLPRPAPPNDLAIINAFSGAITNLNEIYLDNPSNEYILNMYELTDENDIVVGYIYYGKGYGYGGEITFAIGIDILENTDSVVIISHNETWESAYPYTGTEVFPDTLWLQNYEGKTIASILADPGIDGEAGVSTTTGTRGDDNGLMFAFESILDYHLEFIGGAE